MDTISKNGNENKKLFSEIQMIISAFLGGLIPPTMLIYLNYKAIGKGQKAYILIPLSVLLSVLILYGLMILPEVISNVIPSFVYGLFYALIIFSFYRSSWTQDIRLLIEGDSSKGSNWIVAGVTILGSLLNFSFMFGLMNMKPYYDSNVIEVDKNILYYEQSMPIEDVNKLIGILEQEDFFGKDYENVAHFKSIEDEYYITLAIAEEFWLEENTINYVIHLKSIIESEFDKPICIILESFTLFGGSKYKNVNC